MKTGYMKLIGIVGLLLCTFSQTISFSQQRTGNLKIKTEDANGQVLSFVTVVLKDAASKSESASTDLNGETIFSNLQQGIYSAEFRYVGYNTLTIKSVKVFADSTVTLLVKMQAAKNMDELQIISVEKEKKDYSKTHVSGITGGVNRQNSPSYYEVEHNTESYSAINENGFKNVSVNPLSTFSVDVDAASYSNVRRYLTQGNKPPIDAVRVEELINYFEYDYPNPTDEIPFSISTEIGDCPWNNKNKLVHIGLQAQRIKTKDLPPNNLVFLIDVSGSMNSENRLPLLIKSFKLLVNELRAEDRVAIVVYAGAAGVVLEPTPGSQKDKILASLESLRAGGSTAGGKGIQLAYSVARENFMKDGNNRVIIATDGDFNVGVSSDAEMQRLIEKERESGIFLTCLGYGMGNYKDSKLETLANKGNGNYAYIDNLLEAKKVLVTEMGGTLLTLAKDVKIQVEFNPMVVESYRLIGYENRLLNAEDFNDDKKDAGEIGAGHSVTALYEIILKGDGNAPEVDPLRYQTNNKNESALSNEMLTVKFRYKKPDGDKSMLVERNLANKITTWKELSDNFKFSAAVASFGMLLRESEHKGNLTFDDVAKWAKESKGNDKHGYRAEFIRLVELAKSIYETKQTHTAE